MKRCLIVNADDFGQSPGVNRGIIQTHEHGIVTSTSLMVRWPAAKEAGTYARRNPAMSVGLHLDFGEWQFEEEEWRPVYTVINVEDASLVRQEMLRQLDLFGALTGRQPTHIDSHQHAHMREPAHAVITELTAELGLPLRNCSLVPYCGRFYGQSAEGTPLPDALTVEALEDIFRSLSPGITELGCHPANGRDLQTMYLAEREVEAEILCRPELRAFLANLNIELCSFADIGRIGARL